MSETATGRPKDNIPLWLRALAPLVCALVAMEGITQLLLRPERSPLTHTLVVLSAPALRRYLPVRRWVLEHPVSAALVAVAVAAGLLVCVR
jgi:hypothetical protein